MLRLCKREDGLLAHAVAASEEIEQAARAVSEAEHELDLFVNNPKLLSLLGEQRFLEGAEVRQRELDEARQRLAELRSQSALANELADGDLLEAWPALSLAEKRRLLHGLLDRVVLRRADGRGKDGVSLVERTQIVLRGDVLLEPGGNESPR